MNTSQPDNNVPTDPEVYKKTTKLEERTILIYIILIVSNPLESESGNLALYLTSLIILLVMEVKKTIGRTIQISGKGDLGALSQVLLSF
jgi:hypothetical protein